MDIDKLDLDKIYFLSTCIVWGILLDLGLIIIFYFKFSKKYKDLHFLTMIIVFLQN